jgi:hypothetical protein
MEAVQEQNACAYLGEPAELTARSMDFETRNRALGDEEAATQIHHDLQCLN